MSMPKVSVMMPVLIKESDWQLPMTICAIDTLCNTSGFDFELVVVQTGNPDPEIAQRADVYINPPEITTATADCNAGIAACTGDFIVYTGNDVFVRPGWLGALLECFEIDDCGAATLASADLPQIPVDGRIVEGAYGPFMMFPKGWSYDEFNFPCQFADTDMIMRIYKFGKRMYRNRRVQIQHLNRQTLGGPENQRDFHAALERFKRKHAGCPLLAYEFLTTGVIW